jgi:NADH-quinone oxidoreductase subunit H
MLFVFAMSSLGVYGLVFAGYSANNKYSLMGGLRASAQLISYELGMGMSIACIVLAVGSLKPTDMVAAQTQGLWGSNLIIANWTIFTPYGLIAAIVFFICMVAETNRAPFDLPEAENELIAGYHTEYSSFKFASFFMGEYAAMVVWSAIFSTIFLGGYRLLPIRFGALAAQSGGEGFWVVLDFLNSNFGPLWLLLKVALMFSIYVWLRGTLPRLRYDQLMSLGWKTLLPLATANLILVALWIYATRMQSVVVGWLTWIVAAGIFFAIYTAVNRARNPKSDTLDERRRVILVDQPANKVEPEVVTP